MSRVRSDIRIANRGAFTVSGTTKIAGAPAPCRVHLHDAVDGLMIGYRRSSSSGAYSFPDLAAGDYYLVILDDRSNVKRAKVEHVQLA